MNETFYLTTHSAHFIYSYVVLDLMVKDLSDIPLHGLFFVINSKESFMYNIPQTESYTMAFGTSVVEHRLEREIAP